jgi:hypothetical protein
MVQCVLEFFNFLFVTQFYMVGVDFHTAIIMNCLSEH